MAESGGAQSGGAEVGGAEVGGAEPGGVEVMRVPVAGGLLAVHELSAGAPGAPLVLAAHGITANALSWAAVARSLATTGVRLLAPDLRGRAESRDLPGPYGVGAHAEDLVAVLDHVGAERAVLVGHSMGAFVVAVAAARHPGRASALVCVDGGVGFPAPPGADVDAVLAGLLGPAMARLSMRFASPAAYLDFWREHPAVGPALQAGRDHDLEAYLRHDLVADDDGGWVSSCRVDVVRADGADIVTGSEPLGALRAAALSGVPTALLWASRGLLDEPQGLYDEGRLAAAGLPTAVTTRQVPDTNHYTVLLDGPAADAVANVVAGLARGV